MKKLYWLLLLLLLSGCASQQTQVKRRYFWPPLPDRPRIEWLGAYSNDREVRGSSGSLLTAFTGEDDGLSLKRPTDVASNGNGIVVVTDYDLVSFFVIDFNKKTMSLLGPEDLQPFLRQPTGVTFDEEGNLYAADNFHRKIFIISGIDLKVKRVLDLSKEVESVNSLAVDKGRDLMAVSDYKANKVHIFGLSGTLKKSIGVGVKGEGKGELNGPIALAFAKNGNLLVGEAFNTRVQQFTPEGKHVNFIGKRGDAVGDIALLKGLAVDSDNNIYVSDGREHRITIYDIKGQVLMGLGGQYAADGRVAPGGFLLPSGLAIDKNNRLYVADQLNRQIQVFQYISDDFLARNPIEGISVK